MKTVLVIEDNEDIRENTAEILEFSGFSVIAVDSGEHGLSAVFDSRPDVILCDIMMPGLDGYDVIRKLKGDPLTSGIPFIYLTSSGEKGDLELASDMGANGYVRKPFEGSQLVAEIQRCMKQHAKLVS
jgi:CheY-like chemotaxis protein